MSQQPREALVTSRMEWDAVARLDEACAMKGVSRSRYVRDATLERVVRDLRRAATDAERLEQGAR